MTSPCVRRRQHVTLWKVAAFLLVFVASMVSANPDPLTSQPAEPPIASTAVDARTGTPGNAPSQRQPAAMPKAADPDAIEVQMSRRFNDLRRELLDHRANTVDWWLAATAIFLTLLGIVAAIAGYLSFKRFREIEAEARRNVESSGKHAEEARKLVYEIEAQRDKAESLVKGLTAEDVHNNPDMARGAAETVQGDPTASPIDQAVAVAVLLQREGNIEEAIQKWRAIAVISEETNKELAAQAWISVGYLIQEYRKDSFETAIDAYDEAIRLKPEYAVAYNNRSTAKSRLGRHEDAIKDSDEAIRLMSDFPEAYNNRAASKRNLGRHEDAIADFDEAIRLKPGYAGAYNNRGVTKNNLGRHEDAIADYDVAIRLKPDFVEAYGSRGSAKKDLGLHEDAIADYDAAIRLKPDLAEAYGSRGNAKYDLGRYEDAIVDYDEAIRLKPNYVDAYGSRGMTNSLLNRVDEARRDFETAITLARDAGDESLAGETERALKQLLDKQTP